MRDSIVAKLTLLAGAALASCTGPSDAQRAAEMAQMKDEIRREVLAELAAKNSADPGAAAPATATAAGAAPSAPRVDPATLGSVAGRILAQGQGLADCHVKLVRLVESGGLFEAYKTFQEGMEFESVSGPDGAYRIDALPEGSYAARWLPKGESGWIRRLSEKPDAVVKAGAVTQLADLDLRQVTIISR